MDLACGSAHKPPKQHTQTIFLEFGLFVSSITYMYKIITILSSFSIVTNVVWSRIRLRKADGLMIFITIKSIFYFFLPLSVSVLFLFLVGFYFISFHRADENALWAKMIGKDFLKHFRFLQIQQRLGSWRRIEMPSWSMERVLLETITETWKPT